MKLKILRLFSFCFIAFYFTVADPATMTIRNNCPYTVWAAAVPGGGMRLDRGGVWNLNVNPGTSIGSRVWARTNCQFDGAGRGKCETGDCDGLLKCQAYGAPPNTLAEYTLSQYNNLDFFDISLVDGFNVPMEFSPNSGGCTRGIRCTGDIIGQCPAELKAPGGCNNACTVFNTSQYCCINISGNCGPKNYSRFFKERCPDAYSYPEDDQTSTFSCPGGTNYRVVFCGPDFAVAPNAPNFAVAPTIPPTIPPKNPSSMISTKKRRAIIIGSTLGSIFGLLLLCTIVFLLARNYSKKVEEDYLDHISGLPTRFSYEELKVMTKNFSIKLGEGGFGSVFQGTLPDGVKIAVKHLDGLGRVNKSFITEVETIGSIHHFNLVSLVGFCAEKFRRLLVYEYMCNGSLDRWIFNKNKELALSWQSRKKIILDIAKGLAYLHEDCKQKIIHLDIKPQNILLDENFNAKISDFGLSKLVGRNQSKVVTTMRGTPGYMAPEWLSSVITEKVDVYSYGIVVLEVLCGRPNVDRSEPDEDMHLVSLFKRKAEEGQLQDLVDKFSDDMQSNAAEIVETMKVAGCCLRSQTARRPSMSMVVKVLEGSMDIEDWLSYDFSNLPGPESAATVSLILPSILSGPR